MRKPAYAGIQAEVRFSVFVGEQTPPSALSDLHRKRNACMRRCLLATFNTFPRHGSATITDVAGQL